MHLHGSCFVCTRCNAAKLTWPVKCFICDRIISSLPWLLHANCCPAHHYIAQDGHMHMCIAATSISPWDENLSALAYPPKLCSTTTTIRYSFKKYPKDEGRKQLLCQIICPQHLSASNLHKTVWLLSFPNRIQAWCYKPEGDQATPRPQPHVDISINCSPNFCTGDLLVPTHSQQILEH